MRRYLAVLLLVLAFVASATSVPVDIQVSLDPNRPLSLYEGPQTYRRDSRGRPFKSIIVTSKPFGFGGGNSVKDVTTTSTSTTTSRPFNFGRPLRPFFVTSKPFGIGDDNNSVQDSTTTTTTTTTPNPLFVKVTPTIPFFSISCTVGSSCSQIISARQTPTVKPTFKPYTKEEINKFKGTLSSRFPPKVGAFSKANITTTTTATTTTTTTEKPTNGGGGHHLWRIRTTSSPTSTTTTTTTTTTTSKPTRINKPSSNWNSRWKWPTQIGSAPYEPVGQQDVIDSSNQRVETITSGSIPIKPSSAGFLRNPVRPKPNPVRNHYESKTQSAQSAEDNNNKSTKIPSNNNGGWLSLLTASFNALQSHPVQRQQPQQHQTKTTLSTPIPVKIIHRPVKPRPTTGPVIDHQTDRWNSQAAWSNEVNSLSWKPEETITEEPQQSKTKPNYHEVISNKGNKIHLITGSRNQQQQVKPVQPTQYSAVLPPEVSVSSHVIGLRVKPKSLESGGVFIENVQGVGIETDGENVNLSDLIMKHTDLPQQRPARYLPHRTEQSYSTDAGRPENNWSRTIRQQNGYNPHPYHSFDSVSGWRPVRFPHS